MGPKHTVTTGRMRRTNNDSKYPAFAALEMEESERDSSNHRCNYEDVDDDDDDDDEAPLVRTNLLYAREERPTSIGGFRPLKIGGAIVLILLVVGVLQTPTTRSPKQKNEIISPYCQDFPERTPQDWADYVIGIANDPSSWCYQPENCTCQNPTEPWIPDPDIKWGQRWRNGYARNLELVENVASSPEIVFYGDSITEHWLATSLGEPRPNYEENHQALLDLFGNRALPLGLSGDRTPQLIHRLQNGELGDKLKPKYFWILIGINDHLGDMCGFPAIAAGVITIAEYLLKARPEAQVIINSILPFGDPLFESDEFAYHRARLSCYTESHPRLHYFNSTDIFLQDATTLRKEYLPDELHPNGAGSRAWGQAILQFLDTLGV